MTRAEPDKRAELVQQAIRIFSSGGYRATSMNDLARVAGVSKSALYHYFQGKQELLVEIYDGVMAENIAAAKRITEDDQPVVESIRQMLADRAAYTCRNHRILQIFHEEEAELPKRLMNQVLASRRAYQDVMVDLLERGLASGELSFDTTPMLVANVLLGACNWSYKWYNPRGPKSPDELADEVAQLLIRSIIATRDGAEARPALATDGRQRR
jgi:TetR/AcrR family transcriptional regulator, cholesterol catabolism regulator